MDFEKWQEENKWADCPTDCPAYGRHQHLLKLAYMSGHRDGMQKALEGFKKKEPKHGKA